MNIQNFKITTILIISLFLLIQISCNTKQEGGGFISVGFDEPADPDTVPINAWESIRGGLHGSVGSNDIRYNRSIPPVIDNTQKWEGTGWRGERVNIQFVLWTTKDIQEVKVEKSELKSKSGNVIDTSDIQIYTVRYVITDEFLGGYGYRNPDTIPAHLSGDILEPTSVFGMHSKSSRPVWVTIDIPVNVKPDIYKGMIKVRTSSESSVEFNIKLKVLNIELPPASQWKYHLDLFFNPFSIARYYNLELWSPEFWKTLEPYVKILAGAGQKVIMTSIIDSPWKALPVYDEYQSMIERVKKKDGIWTFDYTHFDQYVEFIQQFGISEQISCHTMGTWGDEYRYYDEASSKYIEETLIPGNKNYTLFWKPFLIDFRKHLEERGWLNKTAIAMDERPVAQMKEIIELIKENASGLRIALSVDHLVPELNNEIYDLSSIAHTPLKKEIIIQRSKMGLNTTFYTCTAPPEHPNNYSFSPPADATWLGWYAAAQGYKGFLRFAYNSWTKDPLMDSRYRTWPAGDCYQIYPGPRSSVRFERLREGIQDYEKILILREKLSNINSEESKIQLQELEELLEGFTIESVKDLPSQIAVNNGKALLLKISESITRN